MTESQQEIYEAFVEGHTVPETAVFDGLRDAGVAVDRIRSVNYGYFRKIIVDFDQEDGARKIGKIALHPHSVAMLENEYEGLIESGSNAAPPRTFEMSGKILLVDRVEGQTGGISTYTRPPAPPFKGAPHSMPPSDYVSRFIEMGSIDDADRARAFLANYPSVHVPTGPSHGDFVYWNCIRESGKTHVIDFEAYSRCRVGGYDLTYWHILPLVRRAVHMGMQPAASRLIASGFPLIWKRRIVSRDRKLEITGLESATQAKITLGLTLLEHAAQMRTENALPDIVELIGEDALRLRQDVCAMYEQIVTKMLVRR